MIPKHKKGRKALLLDSQPNTAVVISKENRAGGPREAADVILSPRSILCGQSRQKRPTESSLLSRYPKRLPVAGLFLQATENSLTFEKSVLIRHGGERR